jgi:outer membrane protein OmpA-like peptidoglycan-associated protein
VFDFGLRVELGQLSDTDEHCPIGGLLGLSFLPGRRVAAAAPAVAPPPPTVATPAPAPAPAAPAPPAAAPRATTPPAAPPPAAPPAPKELRETINFDSSSERLSNIAKAKLDEVALRLRQDPRATALVIGHADASGDAAYNETLSRQRAEAARDYLVSRHGIDASRVRVESRGAGQPAADDGTSAGRAENRRVEIVVRVGG